VEEPPLRVAPEVITLLILLGVGLLGGGYVAVNAISTPPTPPDFTVATTDNETFTLTNQTGRVVIVDLFATWCASCQIVEGNLKENVPAWDGLPVTILSLGIDPTDSMEDLRAYKTAHNITWTVAQDTDGVRQKYNTYEIARVVVFDVDGNLVFERSGITSADEFRSVVDDALAGRRAPLGVVQYSVLGLAVVAGAAAFFSPCAVGMLPAYVLRAVHTGPGSAPRALKVGSLAALGVLVMFFGIGGLALIIGPPLTKNVPYLQPLVGFLLVAFGILLLTRPFSTTLQRLTSPLQLWAHDVQSEQGDRSGAFFAYGIGYGAAAAGCTAPVLLSILVTAAAFGPFVGTLIVFAYALTGAFFMVTVTVAASATRGHLSGFLRRYARPIEILSALVLVGGGLFLIWYAARAGTFAARV
jgi:cytochrome c-type biogenesis protein